MASLIVTGLRLKWSAISNINTPEFKDDVDHGCNDKTIRRLEHQELEHGKTTFRAGASTQSPHFSHPLHHVGRKREREANCLLRDSVPLLGGDDNQRQEQVLSKYHFVRFSSVFLQAN
jgi:hypothetical protein